jgi:hypothetical protein
MIRCRPMNKRPTVTVTRVERVGVAWVTCPACGCAMPAGTRCPYQDFHDGADDPQVRFPDGSVSS